MVLSNCQLLTFSKKSVRKEMTEILLEVKKMLQVAVLTGGGCAAGLDSFLEGFVKSLHRRDIRILGISNGWDGLLQNQPKLEILEWQTVEGLVRSGGTIIGTSRANPLQNEESLQQVLVSFEKMGPPEGLVAAGGDDTLTVALALSERGLKIIGVPKTMDLDLAGTGYSLGFWAYNEAVFQMLPRYIETLKAHRRVGVLELFGRHSGFTVVTAGIAGGACYLAIPEVEIDLDQVVTRVKVFYDRHHWALVVVGEAVVIEAADEGKIDEHGNELLFQRRTGEFLARAIEQLSGIETRFFQATHPFRGQPSAYDALIGFRLGLKAGEMVLAGDWGKMLSVQGDEICSVSLAAFRPRRRITKGSSWYDLVQRRNEGLI